jgi:succinate dehydrogenase / fumarate reductase, cytochrome b subunit
MNSAVAADGASDYPGKRGDMSIALPLPRTTVGSKFVVAVTGAILLAFVIGHMAANLQIFLGPEVGRKALNDYAYFLKSKPALLWTARIGLLAALVVHVVLAVQLRRRNAVARPIRYAYHHTEEASFASRTMLWTGLAVLFFLLYHLAHFTLGYTDPKHFALKDPLTGHHDVYAMTVHGFQNPVVSLFYVLAQVFLFQHLSHGTASLVQTLGINRPQYDSRVRLVGWVVATVILVGNVAMPLAVLFGLIKLPS